MTMAQRLRELFRLALPIAAAQAGLQLLGIVDTAVVGRLGARELASVGLGNTVFFAISIVAMGVVMGVDPLLSQAVGAGNFLGARRTLWQGVWLSVGVGAVANVLIALAPLFLPFFGIAEEIVEPTAIYLVIRSFSAIPVILFLALRSYLQAFGKTSAMVIAMIAANVFNLFADILLVFGGEALPYPFRFLSFVPRMEVAGAAIATVLGSILQVVMLAFAIRRHRVVEGIVARIPDWRELRVAIKVGFPIGLQMGAEVGIFALVGILAGTIGETELAAHQVAIMLASFTFTFAVGIGAAGSVLVGRAVGARNRIAARHSGYFALAGGALVMALAALVFWLAPEATARLLTNQTNVIAVVVPLLFVAAFFQVCDGLQAVGAGILRGAADTRYAFIANVIGHWAIGFPIALFLGFRTSLGLTGLWWGLCAGLTAVAIALVARFDRITRTEITPVEGAVHG
jgi:multidrug resistance protein, MATE family